MPTAQTRRFGRRSPWVGVRVVIAASTMYFLEPGHGKEHREQVARLVGRASGICARRPSVMPLRLVRAAWGGALLVAPRPLLSGARLRSGGVVEVMRIIGARHLAEVLILSHDPRGAAPRWPMIVDGLHAATMLAVATLSPRLRREALASAGAATLLAISAQAEHRRTECRPKRLG